MNNGDAKQLLVFPVLDASRALPDFIELELGPSNPENIGPEDVKALQSLYREHCEVRGRGNLRDQEGGESRGKDLEKFTQSRLLWF